MEHRENSFLEQEPVGRLMMKYAVPCIISLLVAALYNIVDQIFIANATYLGSCGNAAKIETARRCGRWSERSSYTADMVAAG